MDADRRLHHGRLIATAGRSTAPDAVPGRAGRLVVRCDAETLALHRHQHPSEVGAGDHGRRRIGRADGIVGDRTGSERAVGVTVRTELVEGSARTGPSTRADGVPPSDLLIPAGFTGIPVTVPIVVPEDRP